MIEIAEEMIRKYQERMKEKIRQMKTAASPRRRAELAAEIDECKQAVKLLRYMKKGQETPEGADTTKYEVR